MKKHLYIFRHGETDWNKERRSQGWIDIPLNNTGIEQANDLAKSLEPIGLDVIYSSPLSRACETAKIVAKPTDISILMHDDLRERNFGIFSGKIVRLTSNPDEVSTDFTQDLIIVPAEKMTDPDFAPENGESRNASASRLYAAIHDIAKKSEHEKIGISTHGGVARSIISMFSDYDLPVGGMPNATYFRLDWDGENLLLNELPEWLASGREPKGGE
jgi:broad specificity phosphatase PhoE